MRTGKYSNFNNSLAKAMKMYMIQIAAVLLMLIASIAWCDDEIDLSKDKPITVTTGIRTGRVTDAITGKPIEGAVVVCNWKITEFGTDWSGAVCETVTDKEGKYKIPSQSVDLEHSLFSRLTPEQMLVYKLGYVWYWMSDKEITPFMVCIPDLPHIYRKENNIIKLQPWNNEMSHVEHMEDLPSYELPMDQLKLLPKTLEEEKKLAEEEKKANVNILKNVNDTDAIPSLIEHVKKNIYRKRSSEEVFRYLRSAINNPAISYPSIVSDRSKLIEEIEKWWKENKDKDPAKWETDDLLKLSHLLQAQADKWRPFYDISGKFKLVSGEVEDINDSPVMTVFKSFKTALIADDPNAVRECFSEGLGRVEADMLIKLRPKFREIADGFKNMSMEYENEFKAEYSLLGPIENGRVRAYPVYFCRDENDNWKIYQFSEYIKQNNIGGG